MNSFPAILTALALAAAPVFASGAVSSPDKLDNDVRSLLLGSRLELLMEKGICDPDGGEIDGLLGKLIAASRARGARTRDRIAADVLRALNDSRTNLGGFPAPKAPAIRDRVCDSFPACAFDRPIGEKLGWFGRTVAASDLDATAEGSACPVGGLGAGAFERTISGNFRTWFLMPGWMVDETVWADQFHVFMRTGGRTVVRTLSADAPSDGSLGRWAWRYPAGRGDYFALFPKSGFSYEENEEFPLKVAVTQFSPILPGNERETSYPVAVYKWIAVNPTRRPVEASVMLTWENMVGWEPRPKSVLRAADFGWRRTSGGNRNELVADGPRKGVLFFKAGADVRTGNAMTGSMCIAAEEIPGKTRVTRLADFDPRGDGAAAWTPFAADGALPDAADSRTAGPDDALAGALAVRFVLRPGERLEFPVVVAWDFPYAECEPGAKYRRKYTEFFGSDGRNAFAVAREALKNSSAWEKAIDAWQREIVGERRLPDWFKQALFNELYLLPETSLWDAETGLHTYLESADYLMYGTFDVDSYCWHILRFWPGLELRNMEYLAGTVALEDPAYKAYQYAVVFPREVPPEKLSYYWSPNKVRGMVPHDVGSPRKRPWVVLNAFDWQNGNVWKDLNPKFPLRAWRDYLRTGRGGADFLKIVFPASVLALDTLERRFGDPASHLPRNEGIPDQTYDTWRMKGESAYVGTLWLAALKAVRAMGGELLRQGAAEAGGVAVRPVLERYARWFDSGRAALARLWNERTGCFNIDASTDDIMTDQLFGLWYAKMLGLEDVEEDRIMPADRARRALRTVFEKNVLGFGGGVMGAVNGRTADGRQLFNQQGDEVWVGTAYAFAADCLLHGLAKEGWRTAYGVYRVVYSPAGQGYFFKTPEAYLNPDEGRWNERTAKNGDRLFRAMKYMRAGAVWAVYEAWQKAAGMGQ